jgi:hypothetical protein
MMKSMLKNGLVVGVAAALVGAAVADTKVRLRAGNNFVVEDRTTSTEAMKVYENGGVAVTSNANPAGNLAGVQAGTLAWDSTDAELQVFDGAAWSRAGSRVALGGSNACTSVASGALSGGTAFNSDTGLLNCGNCSCTANVSGTVIAFGGGLSNGSSGCGLRLEIQGVLIGRGAENNGASISSVTVHGAAQVNAGDVITVVTENCNAGLWSHNTLGVTLVAD